MTPSFCIEHPTLLRILTSITNIIPSSYFAGVILAQLYLLLCIKGHRIRHSRSVVDYTYKVTSGPLVASQAMISALCHGHQGALLILT